MSKYRSDDIDWDAGTISDPGDDWKSRDLNARDRERGDRGHYNSGARAGQPYSGSPASKPAAPSGRHSHRRRSDLDGNQAQSRPQLKRHNDSGIFRSGGDMSDLDDFEEPPRQASNRARDKQPAVARDNQRAGKPSSGNRARKLSRSPERRGSYDRPVPVAKNRRRSRDRGRQGYSRDDDDRFDSESDQAEFSDWSDKDTTGARSNARKQFDRRRTPSRTRLREQALNQAGGETGATTTGTRDRKSLSTVAQVGSSLPLDIPGARNDRQAHSGARRSPIASALRNGVNAVMGRSKNSPGSVPKRDQPQLSSSQTTRDGQKGLGVSLASSVDRNPAPLLEVVGPVQRIAHDNERDYKIEIHLGWGQRDTKAVMMCLYIRVLPHRKKGPDHLYLNPEGYLVYGGQLANRRNPAPERRVIMVVPCSMDMARDVPGPRMRDNEPLISYENLPFSEVISLLRIAARNGRRYEDLTDEEWAAYGFIDDFRMAIHDADLDTWLFSRTDKYFDRYL